MGLPISSCGDDTLQFRRCLAASFFLNAALKQPEGTYRYYISLYKLRHPFACYFRFLWYFYYFPLLTSLWLVGCGIQPSLEIHFHVVSRFPFSYIKTLKVAEMNGRALASGQVVQIHPTSVLHQSKLECVIFDELVQTSQKYIRNTTRIDYLWLTELAPHYYATQG